MFIEWFHKFIGTFMKLKKSFHRFIKWSSRFTEPFYKLIEWFHKFIGTFMKLKKSFHKFVKSFHKFTGRPGKLNFC